MITIPKYQHQFTMPLEMVHFKINVNSLAAVTITGLQLLLQTHTTLLEYRAIIKV